NLSNFGWTKFAAFHNTYLKLKNITLFKLLIRTIFGEAYKGEKTFTETLKNPDYLSDVVDKQTECSFEELMYVATTAFEQKTGKKEEDDSYPRNVAFKRGFNYDFGAPPTKGTNWKTEQLPQLYPKLWVKFN
ncbi:DUF4240 domain-containing protein, partial [Flectobacillus rivi]